MDAKTAYTPRQTCICLLLCLCCLFLCPLCAHAFSVQDDTGHTVHFDRATTRIVSLYGAFSECLLALGLQDSLVGRTVADAHIEALRSVPAVGTHMRPNAERIAALRPHVVLQLLGRSEAESFGLELRRLGIPVLFFRLESFADMFRVLRCLGQMTQTEERAAVLVDSYTQRLARVADSVRHKERVSVFYEVRYPNLLAAGSTSIVNNIIDVAGGRNVVTIAAKVARLNEEELIRLAPQAYIVQRGPMNTNPPPVAQRRHYASLKAVQTGRVLVVDEFMFSRPGPRSIEAAEMLAQWLHFRVCF